jgi:inhibitor of KinA
MERDSVPRVGTMTFAPLGEEAVLAYLSDEAAAVRFADAVRTGAPPWLQDVVPAYASVGVFFNADAARTAEVIAWLRRNTGRRTNSTAIPRRHVIPVCYEFDLDLSQVAEHVGLASDRVIELHLTNEYAVYAIGFVPGFPYLGYLPEELAGVPRLASPRLRVEPGSIGLTGRQTGIYPLARPGGWHLLGRTPLTLVDVADGYFPLRVGDSLAFRRIDQREFHALEGERLPIIG